MLFPPIVEMIAFGYALDTNVKNITTIVFDENRTTESRQLVNQFVNTGTFRVVGEARSITELSDLIRRGKAYVGIQIPPSFTRDLRAGRTARIQVLIDGSNSTIASSALNTSLNVGLRNALLHLASRTNLRDLPVEVRPQILYNPEMRSPNFFVPGVIGVVLQIATTFATAMSLVRERERGTGTANGQPVVALGFCLETYALLIIGCRYRIVHDHAGCSTCVASGRARYARDCLCVALLVWIAHFTRAESNQALQCPWCLSHLRFFSGAPAKPCRRFSRHQPCGDSTISNLGIIQRMPAFSTFQTWSSGDHGVRALCLAVGRFRTKLGVNESAREPTAMTLAQLNSLSGEEFVRIVGPVFEHSPWIAEAASVKRPFASMEELHRALCQIVANASEEKQLVLIRAHPDLVGRAALAGTLTPESTSEQASAGLCAHARRNCRVQNPTPLSGEVWFPFLICARLNKKAILNGFRVRLNNSREREIETALEEIFKIAFGCATAGTPFGFSLIQ